MSTYEIADVSIGKCGSDLGSVSAQGRTNVVVTAITVDNASMLGFQSYEWIRRYALRGYTFHVLRFPVKVCADNEVVELHCRAKHLWARALLGDILRVEEEHEVAFTCIVGRRNLPNTGIGSVLVLQNYPPTLAERNLEAVLVAVSHIAIGE